MFIKLNGQLLVDKSGNPKSFKKQPIEDLEVMFPDQTIEIVHEGGSSKISIEKANRLGITEQDQIDKYFKACAKLEEAKAELESVLVDNRCFYVVDNLPTDQLVGFDWYIQNIDSPDSKLVERVRKARKNAK